MTDAINDPTNGPLPLPRAEEEQPEAFVDNLEMEQADSESLRAITRLLVGGALEDWDEFFSHLKTWEEEITTARSQQGRVIDLGQTDPATDLRYAMIGLLFEGQDRVLRRSKKALGLAWQVTESFWAPLLNRAGTARGLDPARDRYERLVQRGQEVTNRWVDRGWQEESHSRELARTAAEQSFDFSMDMLGQAPALEQLIRDQSVGLTQTAVDEARSRTVSGDLIAEQYARRILRRTPRQDLDEPQPADELDSETADTG